MATKSKASVAKKTSTETAAAKKVTAKKPAAKVTAKTTAKKPAAVKKPAAAPKKAAAKKPAAPRARKAAHTPSPEQRYRMIEVAAYFLAEKNSFSGSSLDYWVAAEAQINGMMGEK